MTEDVAMRVPRTKFLAMLAFRLIHLVLILSVTICAFTFSCAPGIYAQSRGVPYDRSFGPTFYEINLNHSYPATYEQIEQVDFRNLTFEVFDERGKPEMKVKLKKGWYESRDNGGYETVKLDSIYYLPAEDANGQYAVVLYTWFYAGGSSNTYGIAQVFELLDHRLALKQQFEWDEHFDTTKPYASFNAKSTTLIVRTTHYLPTDAHCCVSAMDVVTLQWNGSHFTKKAVRTELSDYCIRAGKKI
jgi:hypothetical protein